MLEDLFRSIDEKVQSEIEKIQEEENEAISALSKDYNKERELRYQKARDSLLKKSEAEVNEAQKALEMQNKFVIQEAKRRILKEIYEAALSKINGLRDSDFSEIVKKMVGTLPDGIEGQMVAGKRTAGVLRSLPLNHRGLDVKEGLPEEGFVVISPKIEIDWRFSQVLEQGREKTDPEILKVLFI